MLQTKEFLGKHIFRVATLTTHSEAVFYHLDRDFDDALPYNLSEVHLYIIFRLIIYASFF